MKKEIVKATITKSSKKAIKRPVYRYQPLMVQVGTVSIVGRNVKQCVALTKCAKHLSDSIPTQIRSDVMSVYTGASNTMTAVKSAKELAEATPPKIKCFGVSVSAGTVKKTLALLVVGAMIYAGIKFAPPLIKKKVSPSPNLDCDKDEEESFVPQEQTIDEIRSESTLKKYDDGQLVGKIIYKGDKVIIFSPPGSGKTVMAMQLAFDIAHGRISKIVPCDAGVHSPQTVFYYDGENDAEDYVNNCGVHNVDTEYLHVFRKFYFPDAETWLKDVREKLQDVKGDTTVVLDNTSCIMSTFNANVIRKLFLRDFTKIQCDFEPYKVTFIVVAHTNKDNELMGSNHQSNFATSILKLSKQNEHDLRLDIIKDRKYVEMQGKAFLLTHRKTEDGYKYDEYVRSLSPQEMIRRESGATSEKQHTSKADMVPINVKQEMKKCYQKGVDGHGLEAIAKKYPEYGLKPQEVKRILESLGVES